MLHLPYHLVSWSTADLKLPGVNVQMTTKGTATTVELSIGQVAWASEVNL